MLCAIQTVGLCDTKACLEIKGKRMDYLQAMTGDVMQWCPSELRGIIFAAGVYVPRG